MKPQLTLHAGRPDRPVVLLIHGLNMNNHFWLDPEKCQVLGGLAPLTVFLADVVARPGNTVSFGSPASHSKGLWTRLQDEGFSLVSWTQGNPLGRIQAAIDELAAVLATVRQQWPGVKVVLVGHSRGGLIARRFLQQHGDGGIAGLVTICSPHAGSGMATFTRYLKPAGKFLKKIIPAKSRAGLAQALARLSFFLQSAGIAELEPESEFMASLQQAPLPRAIRKLSFGGTSPALFHVTVRLPTGSHRTIRFPDLLAAAVPSNRLPKELLPGLGDALVSAESAQLPGAAHYDFPVNHVKAAYDSEVHRLILDFLS
jgi:pimeloyl-ACP methyl ester carboxylesterase